MRNARFPHGPDHVPTRAIAQVLHVRAQPHLRVSVKLGGNDPHQKGRRMPNDLSTYKFASWNVNGLRAVLKKTPSFLDIAAELDADILALQETKLQAGQVEIDLPGYAQVWSYAERKGYSGTAVFARIESLGEPLSVLHADALPLAEAHADDDVAAKLAAEAATEGRICALEFERFWFVDVYTPNAQDGLKRIDVRMAWDDAYRAFLKQLERETGKPVVTCGDFNVAHQEIDLKNPKSNRGNAGFSDEERAKFTDLLDAGYTDTFRAANPGLEGAYSWWSYRFNARKNNAGWRIDYFLVSDSIADRVQAAGIRSDVFGSDHCPVTLKIEL